MGLAKTTYDIDTSSVQGHMIGGMIDRTLFPDQAKAVLDAYKASESGQALDVDWLGSKEDYSPELIGQIWQGVCAEAVEWIDGNCPGHWARGQFKAQTAQVPTVQMG